MKASPTLEALEPYHPDTKEETMLPSYPPFSLLSTLDDESDLVNLPPDTATSLREARQFCKQHIKRLIEVYTPLRSELEREHWGHYTIFHLPTGRYVIAEDISVAEQKFMDEFTVTDDSVGFRIGE